MSTDQQLPTQENDRSTAGWRAVCDAYRRANTLTHHALGMLLKLAVVVYFLFGVTVLGLRYLVLPHIDRYKPDVEQMATRALGNPVTIATIHASWQGLRPRLSLDHVVLHDKFGNEALTLPTVSATLSWWSLPSWELRLHQLEIDQPDLDVLRDADGRLHVAGMLVDTSASGKGKGADWVLTQREIVIRDGRVRWNDYKRAAPELVLDNVNVVLRNGWFDHRFALQATPPATFSSPLDVRARFSHPRFADRISNPAQWRGQLYADLHDTDLTVWKAYFDYPIELQQGKGAVRAWLDFDHAQVANLTADLSLSNVAARLRPDLEPLSLERVSGRIAVREEINPNRQTAMPDFGADGHAIALTDFSLQTSDGLFLPQTTLSESFVPARNGRPEKTEIKAKLLDLQTLADFIGRLPLPVAQRKMLADFAPRGILSDFTAQWQGTYPNLAAYTVKGRFAGLSLDSQAPHAAQPKMGKTPAQASVPAIPGFENLTGEIDANERGGSFSIDSSNLTLRLPAYFAEPVMPFERLLMQAQWGFQQNGKVLVEVPRMDFVQEGVSGSFSGKHLMPLKGPAGKLRGTIDMTGRLSRVELDKTGRYLPLQTPPALRDWLTGALVGGAISDVKLKLKGDLAQFPFHAPGRNDKPRGEFSVVGTIENGKLNYAPGRNGPDGKAPLWPVIEDINGHIAFDRARMEIDAASAKTAGVALSKVKVAIPDLATHDKLLDVDGDAAGGLQEFVRFANDSPVTNWIGHFTDDVKASGNAQLALKLQLPLQHLSDAKVHGVLRFAGNNVTLRNGLPPLRGAGGKLEFHEKGFSIGAIKASFLGGPTTISGGSQRDGTIQVKVDGSVTADGIRKTYSMPVTRQSAERISGGTRYSAVIRVKDGRPEVVVESSLTGLALDFPAPLAKAAGDMLPLRFVLKESPVADGSVARDQMTVSLGSAISARYEREKANDRNADWRVVRGGIGVNVPPPQPDSGVVANVSMKSLNLDAWNRALASVTSDGKANDAANGAAQQTSGFSIAEYIEPEVLAARATELIVMGKKLDNVVVGASHQQDGWQANIDSEQASGYVTWNQPRSGQGLGKVTARLASLVIPKSAASDVTDLLEGKDTTTEMPAVDIVAENFELFGKKFGHLELAAHNALGFGGREWRINKLDIVNPDGELKASGKWISKAGDSQSSLTYTLNITDAGKLLDRFGFANVLRAGKGRMQGEVSWKGMPFALDIPSLSGQFQLNIASGQFLKVDPAAAKLLGVLSLQSLPRRLALDFRDVFSEGFAFDGVSATASIAQGVVKTDNFKMRGVAATVLIDGTADIAKEVQNLHVVVIPEINVGAASVVYGLAVNPVIGVGTFLAQLFLRDPLMKAFTFEYQVTGPWNEPVVTKLARKPPNPSGAVTPNSGTNG
jgi:uncharacterized protein (TIGR02099 family)